MQRVFYFGWYIYIYNSFYSINLLLGYINTIDVHLIINYISPIEVVINIISCFLIKQYNLLNSYC